MNRPIYEAVRKYAESGFSRFCMPGHKGVYKADAALDVTETEFTGDLYEDKGFFVRSCREAAREYGAGSLIYCAGGSTLGVQALMAAFFPRGGRIVMRRASHRSAVNAAALLDLVPVWLPEEGEARRPDMGVFEKLMEGADGAFLTDPDYYGIKLDLGRAARACAARGAPLLTDSAHAAHLPALGFENPVQSGAQGAVIGLHKTLNALTGAAAVLLKDPRMAAPVREWMKIFGSSSPSYLISVSAESALADLGRRRGEWKELAERCLELRKKYPGTLIENDDPTRIVTRAGGEELKKLCARLKLTAEHYGRYGIFIATPQNTELDFERLGELLSRLGELSPAETAKDEDPGLPAAAMTMNAALLGGSVCVPVSASAGMTAARAVCPCPPGLVLLAPGEVVRAEDIKILENYGISRINVVKSDRRFPERTD